MNNRQRDLFLWQWSQRRRLGTAKAAMRGAVIGAIGGLAFAVMLGSDIGSGGHTTASLLQGFGKAAQLLAMSVPVFASMGCLGAWRHWTPTFQH